jgi:hypothetical protein
MEFPIRVVVYLKKDYQIKTLDSKEKVSATFFAPYEKNIEPYIRVATGDYEELLSERGEENAIFAILNSIAHEIIHYRQWLKNSDLDEEIAETEAELEGTRLVDEFFGHNFINEIIEHQTVWTIESKDGVPITTSDGVDSIPFWSTELRTKEVINNIGFYREYHSLEISLDAFINNWLPNLEQDEIVVGANLKGKSLIGHNWNPKELLKEIKNEMNIY